MRASDIKVPAQLLVSIVALACAGADPAPRPTSPVAARVFDAPGFSWRAVELPRHGLRLYIQRGTDADEGRRALTESVLRAQADVLALLAEPLVAPRSSPHDTAGPVPAALFILGSRADMQRLVGRPLAGFVQQDEATAFFVWTSAYRAPLRHELAHLYTFQRWGQPPAGAAATWLVEGIGAWAGGPCLGESPDALAAGLLTSGRLSSVEDSPHTFANWTRRLPCRRRAVSLASSTRRKGSLGCGHAGARAPASCSRTADSVRRGERTLQAFGREPSISRGFFRKDVSEAVPRS
jgi:hypothetical protein